MPLLFIAIVTVPFAMFVGGAYLFNYPVTLGVLYGINVVLMLLVLWGIGNQVLKINSQKMKLSGGVLNLTRDQLSMALPLMRRAAIELPVSGMKELQLTETRLGYQLHLKFDEQGKTMGLDLDLNPLWLGNREVLNRVIDSVPHLKVDAVTAEILGKYEAERSSWKGTYVFSLILTGLALIIFLAVSVYLGLQQ